MAGKNHRAPVASSRTEVDSFLAKVRQTAPPRRTGTTGRLIFAMDATASREPAWDVACNIQGQMFEAVASVGGLEVQLVHYRGFRDFGASGWSSRAADLHRAMSAVRCAGGATQIGRVLEHALAEAGAKRVNALVFVGDCVEESPDALCDAAGRLGLLGVPVFVFHEGGEPSSAKVLREVARLASGIYCRFDSGSADQLMQLLSAVAVFAAGGRDALADHGRERGGLARDVVKLLEGR